jgi:hypothetical protein
MEIKLCIDYPDDALEVHRGLIVNGGWVDLIDGYWGDDTYHSL